MKKTLLFLLLLLTTSLYSQVVELQKLSNGELIHSQHLYNRAQDDIYGYFFVFKKDKLDKKEFLYEYVLLDKNLNQVLSGDFIEKLGNLGRKIDLTCYYREGFISFKIDEIYNDYSIVIRSRYRVLDIKSNSISDSFVLTADLEKEYNAESKSLRKSTVFSFEPNSFGYDLTTPLQSNADNFKITTDNNRSNAVTYKTTGIHYFNEQLDEVWDYEYNDKASKKQYDVVNFLNNKNHSDFIVGRRFFAGSKNEKLRDKGQLFNTFMFFNKDSGQLIKEFTPFGLKTADGINAKDVSNINIYLNSNEKITFLNRIMSDKNKDFILDEKKITGFSKSEYEIATGKELSRNFFTWDKLSKHLSIDKNGYISEKGEPDSFLYFHDAILKSNGNLIFITEQYKTLKGNAFIEGMEGVKINDMILFEVDKDMKLVEYKRIAKEAKNIRNGVKMQGTTASYFGVFDYSGYQDLGDDNYLFFYFNKQRPEGGGKKKWVLGIISNADGKLKEQKLNLKSKDGSDLSIIPAKKGYILIAEEFKDKKKGVEIRLEKIN